MIRTCCNAPLVRIYDSCCSFAMRCTGRCGRLYTQRKRRPEGMSDLDCSWAIPCPAHPHKADPRG